ncbi:MAG: hypothetical protein U0174_24795 [Polyangiaceae bacterium]
MAPFPELSVVRLKVTKTDDKGRSVVAGTRGAIVHVHSVPDGAEPTYIVEVVISDHAGMQVDANIIDVSHDELELESVWEATR